MAVWLNLPAEIQIIILKYLLWNRSISKICSKSYCHICPDPQRHSDYLAIQLVSKEFINQAEAAKILFSRAKTVIYDAHYLSDVQNHRKLDLPFTNIRRLQIPQDCVPVSSKTALSFKDLKGIFPSLEIVNIDMAAPAFYEMTEWCKVYPHVYIAARIAKSRTTHKQWPKQTTWPLPTREQLEEVREQQNLSVKLEPTDHFYLPSSDSIIAQALKVDYLFRGNSNINPYLMAWHARLIHDASLQTPNSTWNVEVRLNLNVVFKLPLSRNNARATHTVRNARLSSKDMLLCFRLAETEIMIPQVLNQKWFDSRFERSNMEEWDNLAECLTFPELQRCKSLPGLWAIERSI